MRVSFASMAGEPSQHGPSMRVALAGPLKGNSPEKSRTTLLGGHPYRLVSYYYARELAQPREVLRSLITNDRDLIIDSGLYSFMFGAEQGKLPSTYEAYRDYTRKYLDDLNDWGLDCFVVESDTHRLLGMDATHRLREEFKPLGSRVIYVWHQPEGLDGLVKLARERDYIALGLPEIRMIASAGKKQLGGSAKSNSMCRDLLKRIHAACGDQPPRIHLLGCTQQELMETRLAWSCDSTSWLSGIRFGNATVWSAQEGLSTCALSSERFVAFTKLACDTNPEAAAFCAEQTNAGYYRACLASAYAYALYQQWLDTRYTPIPCRGDALPEGPVR